MKFDCFTRHGQIITFRTFGFLNPSVPCRLFAPLAYFQIIKSRSSAFVLSWKQTYLKLPEGEVPCHLDQLTNMPLLTCFHNGKTAAMSLAGPSSFVEHNSNNQFSAVQRTLFRYHCRLGHLGYTHLQWLLRQGLFGPGGIHCGNRSVTPPLCTACLHGGQTKRPIQGNQRSQDPAHKGILKQEQLTPGQRIFSDQFVSSVPGRNFNGRGQSLSQTNYVGGTVFCDAASGYLSIHHQVGFTASETIRSKTLFERDATSVGNTVTSYQTDNGVYNAHDFTMELQNQNQTIRYSGVGAHHQNGPAENSIRFISRKARIFMFHAALRWPDQQNTAMWPLAMAYAVHLHNHTPRVHDGLAPVEIWTRSHSNHSALRHAHVWGCPTYVLDASLQDGKKIPRWDPRSRRGVFVGLSPLHASSVGLIFNPKTTRLSPQFHCVYDDNFETIHCNDPNDPPATWEDLILQSRFQNDLDPDAVYEDTWNQPLSQPLTTSPPVVPPSAHECAPSSVEPVSDPSPSPPGPPPHAAPPTSGSRAPQTPFTPGPIVSPPTPGPVAPPSASTNVADPPELAPAPRRSIRTRQPVDRFTFTPANGYKLAVQYSRNIFDTLCSIGDKHGTQHPSYQAAYLTALVFDHTNGILDTVDTLPPDFFIKHPYLFKAKNFADPDTPDIRAALSGEHRDDFIKCMQLEIADLEAHDTWEVVRRDSIKPVKNDDGTTTLPSVIPSTWAFKIKRFPDGTLKKLKARFCARGDKQEDVFATYAPVASWQSIRMLTIMALQKGWVTKQIDFANAFVHAPINKDVYVSLPALFDDDESEESKALCLKLKKSLYGLRDAPKLWSDFLCKGLIKAGFQPCPDDPGVYVGRGMAIATYVDDVLFFGPDAAEMEKVINDLEFNGFKLTREKDTTDTVYDFLGIRIEEFDGKIKMTQHGLISKFLACVGMTDCNASESPCTKIPLGSDANGPLHDEEWEYASAVGMLMYLANNAHPEIQFAVHQCARFTHAPRRSHALAVKRIARYLQGVLRRSNGLIFTKTGNLDLACYVDAGFAGLWKYEDDQDPTCVRSRTGYVMTLGDCPIYWCSKLQTEIALSTCEAEYIALAQSLRDLVPSRRMLDHLKHSFNIPTNEFVNVRSKIFEDNNGAISMASTPKMSPRTKHIGIKYHFVKQYFGNDNLRDSLFQLEKIDTHEQKADIFTKGLDVETFKKLHFLLCGW